MGKEAVVDYQWAEESGCAKVILEAHELILSSVGSRKRRIIPLATIITASVEGELLRLCVGSAEIKLALGAIQAQQWARMIASPPPTLASKLGINRLTHLSLIGEFELEELKVAVSQAGLTTQAHSIEAKKADLILANVKTVSDLHHVLDLYKGHTNHPPIWIIYPKGVKSSKVLSLKVGETLVRNTLRQEGLVDTKVTSVSPELTALRFIKRSK